MYLRQPEIAQIVVDSFHKGVNLGHYELGAYVIMANHVHLLIQPLKAGLVRNPEDYPWSSAGVEKSLDAARKSACAT